MKKKNNNNNLLVLHHLNLVRTRPQTVKITANSSNQPRLDRKRFGSNVSFESYMFNVGIQVKINNDAHKCL